MIRDYKDNPTMQSLCREYRANNQIEPEMYKRYRVKRGLRNADGTGVMAGLTRIPMKAGLHTGVTISMTL